MVSNNPKINSKIHNQPETKILFKFRFIISDKFKKKQIPWKNSTHKKKLIEIKITSFFYDSNGYQLIEGEKEWNSRLLLHGHVSLHYHTFSSSITFFLIIKLNNIKGYLQEHELWINVGLVNRSGQLMEGKKRE